jgi:polysaccharide biosynthesis protein PslE
MATPVQFAAGDYLRVIFKRKVLIASVFLAVALGLGITIFRQPVIYEVSGKLLVQRARAELLLTPASTGYGFILPQQQDLTAEVELLKSPSLSKTVVKKLGMYREPQVTSAAQPALLAGLLPVPDNLTAWLPPWLSTWLGGDVTDREAPPERNTASPLDRAAASVSRKLTVQAIPNSNVIEVRYRTDDPSKAVDVVNTLLTEYLDRYLEVRRTPGVTAFFTTQLNLYELKLQHAEEALRQFEQRTALINTNVQMEAYSRQLADAEQRLLKARYDILDKHAKMTSNKADMQSLPERIITNQTFRANPMVETIHLRLLELETEREKLLQTYTASDRRVGDIDERIATLRQRLEGQSAWVAASETFQPHPLRSSLQESIVATQASLSRLKLDQQEAAEQVSMIRGRISEIARQAVDRGVLTREVRSNEDAYLLYLKKVEEARISEAMDQQKMMNVTIAEEASPATAPLTQKRLSYIFALMVGLVGGVGSGFLREFFDDSVKTSADVTSSTALPVLASIPEEDLRAKKNGGTTRTT